MKTKAVVFRSANRPSLEEIEIPGLQDNELLVKNHYSGVSIGTESSIFSGERTHNGTFPLVGGYMSTGEVIAVGRKVAESFKEGDKVAALVSRLDGEVNSVWGGHCASRVVPAECALQLPKGASMLDSAFFILPGVGLNAASMAEINEQDTVLVFGQGLIGQYFAQWAGNRGAKVITVEPDSNRAALSRKNVTPFVIDPFNDELTGTVAEFTNGAGPSVVVEATASPKVLEQATKFLKADGKMIFLSWYPGNFTLNFADFHNNGIRAYFPTGAGNNETLRAVLTAFANGSIKCGGYITDVYGFSDACEGYNRIIGGDKSILGMAIDWRNA